LSEKAKHERLVSEKKFQRRRIKSFIKAVSDVNLAEIEINKIYSKPNVRTDICLILELLKVKERGLKH